MKKVLNLFAGIGGNRKHWKDVEVTAIEYNEEIANVYKQLHPNDNVIVADAHEYLAKHWREFDFIWSSPPCQSHSKVRMMASKGGSYDAVMPDMRLWAEIIFLQNFTKNTDIKFVVENVKPYYEPFIKPTTKLGRHLFWANFEIPQLKLKTDLHIMKEEVLKKVILIYDHIKWNTGKTKLFVIALTLMLESMFFGVRWEIACNG